MNERELEALSKTVAYLWHDEKQNLEEYLNGNNVPEDHIFRQLEVLDGYLRANKAPAEGEMREADKAVTNADTEPSLEALEFLANVGLATSRLEDAHAFLKTIWLVAQDIQEAQKIPY